jgi:hypothetical protein
VRWRLFNLATAASLVLCIATVVLWVRSAYRYDYISRESDRLPRFHWARYSLNSTPGRLGCAYESFQLTATPASAIVDRGWHHQSGRYRTNSLILSDVPAAESAFSYEFRYENIRSKTVVKDIPGMYSPCRLVSRLGARGVVHDSPHHRLGSLLSATRKIASRALSRVRLRPARHTRAMSGMRDPIGDRDGGAAARWARRIGARFRGYSARLLNG